MEKREDKRIYQFWVILLACIDIVFWYAQQYVNPSWDGSRFVVVEIVGVLAFVVG